jgi:hypothetical protein
VSLCQKGALAWGQWDLSRQARPDDYGMELGVFGSAHQPVEQRG